MKIKFTTHAKFRMMERGVDAMKVRSAIVRPDKKKTLFGAIQVQKEFDGRILEVVYKRVGHDILVVTSYYL